MQATEFSSITRHSPAVRLGACCGLLLLFGLGGCRYFPTLDKVIPDRRDEYKKHRELPDLEVPPDLTLELPKGKGLVMDDGSARRAADAAPGAEGDGGIEVSVLGMDGESGALLQVTGSLEKNWSRLRAYWSDQGRTLSLDDMELGVMETTWSEPYPDDDRGEDRGGQVRQLRDKVTIVGDVQTDTGVLSFYIRQAREVLLGEDGAGGSEWLPDAATPDAEQRLAGELAEYLGARDEG